MASFHKIQKFQIYDEAIIYSLLEAQELGREMPWTTLEEVNNDPTEYELQLCVEAETDGR